MDYIEVYKYSVIIMIKISHLAAVILIVVLLIPPSSAAIKACVACNSTCNSLPALNATIAVNSTFTGAPGSFALVNNIGTPSAALLDFTIPAGANGADGADGTPATHAETISSDFYDGTANIDAIPGLSGLTVSSGTTSSVATDANHPGVIYVRDSTTANGGYKFGCSGTQLIGGNEFYEVIFQSVGIRTTQQARMGWSDSATSTLPTDGIYFNISRDGAIMNLTGISANGGTRNPTTTGYSLTGSTWYHGTIQVNSAATQATFTLYDSSRTQLWQSTIASGLPTGAGRDTSPCIIATESTTDAGANILLLDYTRWVTDRALVR